MPRIRLALLLVLCLCLLSSHGAWACNDTVCFVSGADVATLVAVRERPDDNAPLRCWFYAGMGFSVLNHENGWLAVRVEGVPGFPDLPETFTVTGGDILHPNGYIAESDVHEVGEMSTKSFIDLLPEGTFNGPVGEAFLLLSAPDADASPQALLMPGTLLRLLGKVNGYYLARAGEVCGYVSEDSVNTNGHSAALPANLLWERTDYYADFPLTFALVNTETDDGIVPLMDSPSSQAKQLSEYPCGQVVRIVEDGSPYCLVQTADHEGYMERASLLLEGEVGKRTLVGIRSFCTTLSMEFDLRTFPDTNAPLIGHFVTAGVSVLGVAGSWYYVSVYDEYPSWVCYQGFMRPSLDYDTGYWLGDYGTERTYGILMLPEDMTRLPLYADASTDSKILGRYFNNTQVDVLGVTGIPSETIDIENLEMLPWYVSAEEEGVFLRVRVDELEGYMPFKYVSVVQRSNPSVW